MEDKTYIEALMQAPSHPEHDMTLQDAMQDKALKKKRGHTLARVIATWKRIHKTIHDTYLQAGYPYGDTEEGLQHWMQDLATIKDHQIAIDCILQSHQNKIDARKLGERIRAKRLERGE